MSMRRPPLRGRLRIRALSSAALEKTVRAVGGPSTQQIVCLGFTRAHWLCTGRAIDAAFNIAKEKVLAEGTHACTHTRAMLRREFHTVVSHVFVRL
jgi:hypothetical protein